MPELGARSAHFAQEQQRAKGLFVQCFRFGGGFEKMRNLQGVPGSHLLLHYLPFLCSVFKGSLRPVVHKMPVEKCAYKFLLCEEAVVTKVLVKTQLS